MGENQKYAFAMEDEGHMYAKDFQHFDKDAFKNDVSMSSDDAATAMAIMSKDDKRTYLLQGFVCPDRPRIGREFSLAYPKAETSMALEFAKACSDMHGRGKVSLIMHYNHFKRHEDAPQEAFDTIEDELTNVQRVKPAKPAPPPEPTDFVAGWLKENGLENYTQNFLGQGFSTEHDLRVYSFTDEQLEKTVGINKLAH